MKVLSKEEEREHYNATVKGGIFGGLAGLGVGAAGVFLASQRYPAFRQLTLPLRAFLVTSSGTFAAIVAADSYSRRFEQSKHPDRNYHDESQTLAQQVESQKGGYEKTMDWLAKNKYSVVFGSWVASMGTAFGLVGRNPYLSGQQKLVQARVYAQGLTLAVVIISLAFEGTDKATGKGRWETVKVLDPNDPEHKRIIEKKIHHEAYAGEDQWRDMVEAEEERIKEREKAVQQREEMDKKKGKKVKSKHVDEVHGDPKKGDEKVKAP